ncbi:MAG: rhomboid family intramembrane serine protease [Phycisphaerae bacterium]
MIIPIRTESDSRHVPMMNYALIGLNMLVFLVFNVGGANPQLEAFRDQQLAFQSASPALHQFLTYQFLHADAWHLLGNMLFLWVFGNSVNGKMGDWPYLLFYLGGGIFAAWGFAVVRGATVQLVGASGAIAAVTTAYLVLFPRSRVTVMIWMFFVYFIEVSAMLVIGLKIIVYDNIISPSLHGAGNVANEAHLAGYLFGFACTVVMLMVRALPRDQFDMLALWKRWNQRREFAAAMAQPGAAAQAQFGQVARGTLTPAEQRAENERFDRIADARARIATTLESGQTSEAATQYLQLLDQEPAQCMPENQQMEMGRDLYGKGQYNQAARVFERFVECYPRSLEHGNVMFLLGIIYARDLQNFEQADQFLTRSYETMKDEKRREQCLNWLKDVRSALGRPAPEL